MGDALVNASKARSPEVVREMLRSPSSLSAWTSAFAAAGSVTASTENRGPLDASEVPPASELSTDCTVVAGSTDSPEAVL